MRKCSLMLMTVFLPPLIQVTTLEGDYKALTYLKLMNTPLLEEENGQQVFDNVLPGCVRIQVDGHYGSGSIYRMLEDEIIIITNRHVLQYWNEDSYVTFFNGAVGNGVVLGISETADVGFIQVPVSCFSWQELLTFRNVRPVLRQRRSDLVEQSHKGVGIEPGEGFVMIDMASDVWNPEMISGEVISASTYLEDFEMEMFYGEGFARPGMSGSGVFDEYGYYLGMLTGGTLQGEIAAVPAEIIEEEYNKYNSARFKE